MQAQRDTEITAITNTMNVTALNDAYGDRDVQNALNHKRINDVVWTWEVLLMTMPIDSTESVFASINVEAL